MDVYAKIRVFSNNRVIIEAPDSPRTPKTHKQHGIVISFPFKKKILFWISKNLYLCTEKGVFLKKTNYYGSP